MMQPSLRAFVLASTLVASTGAQSVPHVSQVPQPRLDLPPCAITAQTIASGLPDCSLGLALGDGFAFIGYPDPTGGSVDVFMDVGGPYALVQTIVATPGLVNFGGVLYEDERLFVFSRTEVSVYVESSGSTWELLQILPFPGVTDIDGRRMVVATGLTQLEVRGRDVGGPDQWGVEATIDAPTVFSPNPQQLQFLDAAIRGDVVLANTVTDIVHWFTALPVLFEENAGGPGAWGERFVSPPARTDFAFATLGTDRAFVGTRAFAGQGPTDVVHGRNVGGASTWGPTIHLPTFGSFNSGPAVIARDGWATRTGYKVFGGTGYELGLYEEREDVPGFPVIYLRGVVALPGFTSGIRMHETGLLTCIEDEVTGQRDVVMLRWDGCASSDSATRRQGSSFPCPRTSTPSVSRE